VIGEFFACPREGIDAPLLADGANGRYPGFSVSGLTPVNVATRGDILGTGSYDEVLAAAVADHQEAPSEHRHLRRTREHPRRTRTSRRPRIHRERLGVNP
jgi:hypothetical protein